MSTPNSGSDEPRLGYPATAITFVYDSKRDSIPEGDPRRKTCHVEPKVEVAYDRSRHVIQITEPGGKTAEFDDRPVRYLLMVRDPKTKALKPVIEWGKPVCYYLAPEKWAVGGGQ
jgi:hypothetical protein